VIGGARNPGAGSGVAGPASPAASSSQPWSTGDQICVPDSSAAATANLSPASGQPYLTGGPGMVVPGGTEVQGITFVANGAGSGLTNSFAFIAIPDEDGLAQATVVAVSENLLTAAWATNAQRKFSFRVEDGGSGFWTPSVDTPVYGGIVQVGTTPASLRGVTSSGQTGSAMTPKRAATSAGGVTIQSTLSTVMALGDAATVPFCRLSKVYN